MVHGARDDPAGGGTERGELREHALLGVGAADGQESGQGALEFLDPRFETGNPGLCRAALGSGEEDHGQEAGEDPHQGHDQDPPELTDVPRRGLPPLLDPAFEIELALRPLLGEEEIQVMEDLESSGRDPQFASQSQALVRVGYAAGEIAAALDARLIEALEKTFIHPFQDGELEAGSVVHGAHVSTAIRTRRRGGAGSPPSPQWPKVQVAMNLKSGASTSLNLSSRPNRLSPRPFSTPKRPMSPSQVSLLALSVFSIRRASSLPT